ncbi:hypothetical protein [uncultured Methylobacterium sp.]|uniref:hypothetical protein n=1 Tax=uncultured Methylobacterium sp. TaxID=157278 RepID=UPI0026314A7D|nr:hypothetical protein [uncultured Methylobacterium sp.]
MRETFHIDILGPDEAGPGGVMQRISVRATAETARERALRAFRRARVPQRTGPPAEAVRVVDGAGTEVFRWSVWDEGTGGR